jgi:hypothetical protein
VSRADRHQRRLDRDSTSDYDVSTSIVKEATCQPQLSWPVFCRHGHGEQTTSSGSEEWLDLSLLQVDDYEALSSLSTKAEPKCYALIESSIGILDRNIA